MQKDITDCSVVQQTERCKVSNGRVKTIHIHSLNESFFVRRLYHEVQFESGSLQFLFLGTVGSVERSLFSSKRNKDDETDDGHK